MRPVSRAFPLLLLAAAAAACSDSPEETPKPATPAAGAPAGAPPAKPTPGSPATPVKKELPKFDPLTEETARRVLRGQLDKLTSDEPSRAALLYLADLGDRSAVNVIHDKLLTLHEGAYEDAAAAAIGAEALLAFGEADAVDTVFKVAAQYQAEEDTDEFLVHALARVPAGPRRGEAVALLLKVAEGEGTDYASEAIEALASSAAPEAREAFGRIAANAELDTNVRAAAIAGLLHLGDPKGKDLAEKLVGEATDPEGKSEIDSSEVIAGLGVEGAVEAVPYVRRLVDDAVAGENPKVMWEAEAAATAISHIHAKGGGAELVPWWREIAKKDDGNLENDAAFALWTLGDDPSAAVVAKTLEDTVSGWNTTSDMSSGVEILDIAARRGVAAKPPFRSIVDTSAQVSPDASGKGVNSSVVLLNLAAAHAFLKSTAK